MSKTNIKISYNNRILSLSKSSLINGLNAINNYTNSTIEEITEILEQKSSFLLEIGETNITPFHSKVGYSDIIFTSTDIYSRLYDEAKKINKEDLVNIMHLFEKIVLFYLFKVSKNTENMLKEFLFLPHTLSKKEYLVNKLSEIEFDVVSQPIYPMNMLIEKLSNMSKSENSYFSYNSQLSNKLKNMTSYSSFRLYEKEFSFPIHNYEIIKQFYQIPYTATYGESNYDYFYKRSKFIDSDEKNKMFVYGFDSVSSDTTANSEDQTLYFPLMKSYSSGLDGMIAGINYPSKKVLKKANENSFVSIDEEYEAIAKLIAPQFFGTSNNVYSKEYKANFGCFNDNVNTGTHINYISKYLVSEQLVRMVTSNNEDDVMYSATPLQTLRAVPANSFVNGYFNSIQLLEEYIRRIYYPKVLFKLRNNQNNTILTKNEMNENKNFTDILFDRQIKRFLNTDQITEKHKAINNTQIVGKHILNNGSHVEDNMYKNKYGYAYGYSIFDFIYSFMASPTNGIDISKQQDYIKHTDYSQHASDFQRTPDLGYNINTFETKPVYDTTNSMLVLTDKKYRSTHSSYNILSSTFEADTDIKHEVSSLMYGLMYKDQEEDTISKKYHFIKANAIETGKDARPNSTNTYEEIDSITRYIYYGDLSTFRIISDTNSHANITVAERSLYGYYSNKLLSAIASKHNINIESQEDLDYINSIIETKGGTANMLYSEAAKLANILRKYSSGNTTLMTEANTEMNLYSKDWMVFPPILSYEDSQRIVEFLDKYVNRYLLQNYNRNSTIKLSNTLEKAIISLNNDRWLDKSSEVAYVSEELYRGISTIISIVESTEESATLYTSLSSAIAANQDMPTITTILNSIRDLYLNFNFGSYSYPNLSIFKLEDNYMFRFNQLIYKAIIVDYFNYLTDNNKKPNISDITFMDVYYPTSYSTVSLRNSFSIYRLYDDLYKAISFVAEYRTGLKEFIDSANPLLQFYTSIAETTRRLPMWSYGVREMYIGHDRGTGYSETNDLIQGRYNTKASIGGVYPLYFYSTNNNLKTSPKMSDIMPAVVRDTNINIKKANPKLRTIDINYTKDFSLSGESTNSFEQGKKGIYFLVPNMYRTSTTYNSAITPVDYNLLYTYNHYNNKGKNSMAYPYTAYFLKYDTNTISTNLDASVTNKLRNITSIASIPTSGFYTYNNKIRTYPVIGRPCYTHNNKDIIFYPGVTKGFADTYFALNNILTNWSENVTYSIVPIKNYYADTYEFADILYSNNQSALRNTFSNQTEDLFRSYIQKESITNTSYKFYRANMTPITDYFRYIPYRNFIISNWLFRNTFIESIQSIRDSIYSVYNISNNTIK